MPKIPGVNHLRAVRALEKAGFKILRQGKHIVMSDGSRFPFTIQSTL
jgi:predicted RNA binding protein YcfA (HicA-like mRNA interferase family)